MKARRIDIKLSDYEFKQIEAEAIRRGMNKSELIRSLIAQFPAPPKAGLPVSVSGSTARLSARRSLSFAERPNR